MQVSLNRLLTVPKLKRRRKGKVWEVGAKAAAVEVISQIPWPTLSCLSGSSTVVLCPK